jgi:hypothetical protein
LNTSCSSANTTTMPTATATSDAAAADTTITAAGPAITTERGEDSNHTASRSCALDDVEIYHIHFTP